MRKAPSLPLRLALLAAAGLGAAAASAAEWTLDRVVPGGPFRGVHGIGFARDGTLWAGSVMGQALYRVDPQGGTVDVAVPPPAGMADDVEFGPDGTVYWTGFMRGTLNAMSPRGGPRAIASGLPGLNSLAMNADGRLFATQVFAGDALWEFDPAGKAPPRRILEGMGGLNGFDFGPDGRLCGPLWFRGQVVCVDVDSAALEVVAEGFTVPAAANFDSQGRLHAIDNETGEVFRIDIATKTRHKVAQAPTNLDNLAFDADDRLYVSNMSDNAIYEIPLDGSPARTVVGSPLGLPGGIGIADGTLYVADTFTLSQVDLVSGAVSDLGRSLASSGFPTTLAVLGDRMATASTESRAVQLRDRASGTTLATWHGGFRPVAVALLDAGRVAVADLDGGRILLLDARRPEAREVMASGLAQPMGLARRGAEWAVSESAAGRVTLLGAAGARRTLVEGLERPEGLAWLPDGRLAVAETGRGRLLLVDAASGAVEVAARGLPLGIPDLPGAPPGMFPTGVAVDAAGVVYLSSDREGSILRLRPPATGS